MIHFSPLFLRWSRCAIDDTRLLMIAMDERFWRTIIRHVQASGTTVTLTMVQNATT